MRPAAGNGWFGRAKWYSVAMGATSETSSLPTSHAKRKATRVAPGVALAALGVVFGDIGTSPLYTLKTCFATANVGPEIENVLGILSLLLWALIVVVCVKYVGVLMRVDHDGEGGILALLALARHPGVANIPAKANWLTWVVVVGAAMLFGDGIITPAISVISAVEGVGVATKAAEPFIVPISVAILAGLFIIQSRGTDRVGKVFGPVMALWFVVIGVTGAIAIAAAPQVMWAFDPRHAIGFATHHGAFGFLVFGAIVLAVTGVEALYADLSHFGRRPIALAWFALVAPALALNYLGQGARVLTVKSAFDAPFYALTPGWMLVPMVVLATIATVIASQALISGAFTLTEQAINLSLWPRLTVRHTSRRNKGQVYVPAVNWLLAIACIALVFAFRSSDRLAAAYGLAVSTTMFATSIAFYFVVSRKLQWKPAVTVPLVAMFMIVDGTFVAASLPKFLAGAWVPFAISAVFVFTALTWLEGRRCVARSLVELSMPLEQYRKEARPSPSEPVGTMVFLTGDPDGIPFIGSKHRWIRARADEERVVLLTLQRVSRPYVAGSERVAITTVSPRLSIVKAGFGYMERPSIKPILTACGAAGLHLDSDETSFFYADPKIVRAESDALPRFVRAYFRVLSRNAQPLPDDLGIRAERRVELGVEVPI
ncbi:MAG: potassium transporter Kup [Vulcanimicrobiaceae bacterium]